jgi:hypothetical protein
MTKVVRHGGAPNDGHGPPKKRSKLSPFLELVRCTHCLFPSNFNAISVFCQDEYCHEHLNARLFLIPKIITHLIIADGMDGGICWWHPDLPIR